MSLPKIVTNTDGSESVQIGQARFRAIRQPGDSPSNTPTGKRVIDLLADRAFDNADILERCAALVEPVDQTLASRARQQAARLRTGRAKLRMRKGEDYG